MYINPFWAGVAVTILAEVGALLLYAILTEMRKRKK